MRNAHIFSLNLTQVINLWVKTHCPVWPNESVKRSDRPKSVHGGRWNEFVIYGVNKVRETAIVCSCAKCAYAMHRESAAAANGKQYNKFDRIRFAVADVRHVAHLPHSVIVLFN